MQRLQIMRMPRAFGLLSAVLLTSACAGSDGGADTAVATPPATEAAPAAGTTSSAAATQAAPSAPDKAPTQATAKPAAAAAGATATAPASAGVAGSPASASPDAPATATAGAEATPPAAPDEAAAGSGAAGAATEGAAGAAGAPAVLTEDGIDPLMPDWSKRTDLGEGDGSDVVTIGDSWMDYVGGGGGIQAGLDRAGKNYRHYGLSATTLTSGQIPGQYTRAKGVNPDIKTVIMTGGGNDVMFTGGCNTAELCEMSVARIQEALNVLWTEMADDGVKDVIYIAYSADAGTAPTDTRPKEVKPVPICLTGRILCHNLQTTDLVMGQLVDGIHPTRGANDRIAAAVIELMNKAKMRR
jgi:hypothetical protein